MPGMGLGTQGEMYEDFRSSLGAELDLLNGERISIKKQRRIFKN